MATKCHEALMAPAHRAMLNGLKRRKAPAHRSTGAHVDFLALKRGGVFSLLRIEPGDHLPQRRREVLIVTLHGILPAIPGMVALFRAVQVIVRTRLTDRERPFSVIGPGP